jgi:tagatose-1,6-bisphosphate aldolase non-catalytic subunit AgaZ/GatZ
LGISETDYYYERIRENPGAYKVKDADMDDNTEDWRLVYLTDETRQRLSKKYAHGRRVLMYGSENAAHREQFLYE